MKRKADFIIDDYAFYIKEMKQHNLTSDDWYDVVIHNDYLNFICPDSGVATPYYEHEDEIRDAYVQFIVKQSTTIQLDYGGFEQVCFDTMKWGYKESNGDTDVRALRRINEHDWQVTSDHGGWQNFDQGCGETTVLEEYYQGWLLTNRKPKQCTCGAKHTSNPNFHTDWCDHE